MIIYKCTCLVTNKIYIGKTTETLERRKQRHLYDAKTNKYNMYIHKAIRKYGEDNFRWEVLDEIMILDMLSDLERFYIKKYKAKVPHGYNLTDGGEGISGFVYTDELRQKISKAHRGFHPSAETREKMSLAHSGKNNHHFGKHPSLETLKKMSDANIGRKHSTETRKKMSVSHMGLYSGNKHPMFGKHHTDETREKIRKAQKGKLVSMETRMKLAIATRARYSKIKEDTNAVNIF